VQGHITYNLLNTVQHLITYNFLNILLLFHCNFIFWDVLHQEAYGIAYIAGSECLSVCYLLK
jgi:hypothetical protein